MVNMMPILYKWDYVRYKLLFCGIVITAAVVAVLTVLDFRTYADMDPVVTGDLLLFSALSLAMCAVLAVSYIPEKHAVAIRCARIMFLVTVAVLIVNDIYLLSETEDIAYMSLFLVSDAVMVVVLVLTLKGVRYAPVAMIALLVFYAVAEISGYDMSDPSEWLETVMLIPYMLLMAMSVMDAKVSSPACPGIP